MTHPMELFSQALCKYSPVVMETMYLSNLGLGSHAAVHLSALLHCPEFDGVVFKCLFLYEVWLPDGHLY